MQVLEWIRRYPLVVDKGVCIALAMSLLAQALAFDIVGRNAIQADSAWAMSPCSAWVGVTWGLTGF